MGYPAFVSILQGTVQCFIVIVECRVIHLVLTVEEAQIVVYADVLFQIIYLWQVGSTFFFMAKASSVFPTDQQCGLFVQQDGIHEGVLYVVTKGAVEATLRFIVILLPWDWRLVVEVCQQSVVGISPAWSRIVVKEKRSDNSLVYGVPSYRYILVEFNLCLVVANIRLIHFAFYWRCWIFLYVAEKNHLFQWQGVKGKVYYFAKNIALSGNDKMAKSICPGFEWQSLVVVRYGRHSLYFCYYGFSLGMGIKQDL